jgi:DNA-binding helix-hairpin-helix protein with protein kinase domain
MFVLSRRIAKLETQRPTRPRPIRMLPLSDLDPAVAAMFIARDYNVNLMNLAELNLLAAELRRLTV